MAFEIFCVELPNGGDSLERVNKFMATHVIVSKQQHLVSRDGIPYMMFCLEYVQNGTTATAAPNSEAKADVWSSLDSTQREQFNRLRDLRNQLAEQEHVKPFVVFTNDQLGEMVKGRVTTLEAMKGIRDVGKARLEKFAPQLLPILKELFSDKGERQVAMDAGKGEEQ
ncbi:MAG: HRDC domain-containing protein [Victivallales bacterium]|nr:HRDC domain-containing protein [Victivallales bacterium]